MNTVQKAPLVFQDGAVPTRKWKYGAMFSIVLVALLGALQAYDAVYATSWSPIVYAIMGSLGFAIPSYFVQNRAVADDGNG